jgi:hypothetical protein
LLPLKLMQTLTLKRREVDLREYCDRRAHEDDCATLLKDEFKLVDEETGKVVALYCKPTDAEQAFNDIFDACLSVKYVSDFRTNGLKTTSRIFGYNPRNALRKDFCSAASLAHDAPELHQRVLRGGAMAAKYYAYHNQELYDEHLQTTKEKIVTDYQLPEVPFTSGIINDNNPLCYHFDSGNFSNVWSAMIVLKHKISGGYLSMPEYDVLVEVANHSIFYFDGQAILHGVTPITKLASDSRRFSLVYYSLKAMWNCQPLRDEIARARMRREEVEQKRLLKR